MDPFILFLMLAAAFSFFVPFACGVFPKIGIDPYKNKKPAASPASHPFSPCSVDVRFLISMVIGICFLTLGFQCIPILLNHFSQNEIRNRLLVILVMAIATLIALMISLKKNNFGWISREK